MSSQMERTTGVELENTVGSREYVDAVEHGDGFVFVHFRYDVPIASSTVDEVVGFVVRRGFTYKRESRQEDGETTMLVFEDDRR